MPTTTCATCHTLIPAGLAVLRGNGRTLTAWHRECFELRRAVEDVFVPEQRRPAETTRKVNA